MVWNIVLILFGSNIWTKVGGNIVLSDIFNPGFNTEQNPNSEGIMNLCRGWFTANFLIQIWFKNSPWTFSL